MRVVPTSTAFQISSTESQDGFQVLLSYGPPRRENLGLLQDGLHGGILKVCRITVRAEDAHGQNPHARPCRLLVLPVHRSIVFQAAQQLVGDQSELVISHDLDRALVLGQGVIEGNFLLAESFLLAASVRGTDVLGELDQLLE